MNSYPAPLTTKRTAGQQERWGVKWTVHVAVVTEDPADRSMIRSMDVFQKIWRIAGHTGFQTNRHGVYTNA